MVKKIIIKIDKKISKIQRKIIKEMIIKKSPILAIIKIKIQVH
jgi:hypothetical protein